MITYFLSLILVILGCEIIFKNRYDLLSFYIKEELTKEWQRKLCLNTGVSLILWGVYNMAMETIRRVTGTDYTNVMIIMLFVGYIIISTEVIRNQSKKK